MPGELCDEFRWNSPHKGCRDNREKEQLRRAVEQVERIESKCDDGIHSLRGDESRVTHPECQALHEDAAPGTREDGGEKSEG